MSRTAKSAAYQWKTIYSVVLLILSFCLVAHFLVEDVSLQRAADSFTQHRASAGAAFGEIEHLDDLAVSFDLPQSIPQNQPPVVAALSTRIERQVAFPIRIPPKIA